MNLGFTEIFAKIYPQIVSNQIYHNKASQSAFPQ